jgi:hypothetical protein
MRIVCKASVVTVITICNTSHFLTLHHSMLLSPFDVQKQRGGLICAHIAAHCSSDGPGSLYVTAQDKHLSGNKLSDWKISSFKSRSQKFGLTCACLLNTLQKHRTEQGGQ